jgi:hypothetical protein
VGDGEEEVMEVTPRMREIAKRLVDAPTCRHTQENWKHYAAEDVAYLLTKLGVEFPPSTDACKLCTQMLAAQERQREVPR